MRKLWEEERVCPPFVVEAPLHKLTSYPTGFESSDTISDSSGGRLHVKHFRTALATRNSS